MSNLYYLRNTLSNIEAWFDGFVCCMHDFITEDTPETYHQLIILYDRQITEIVEHAKSLLNEIEKGNFDEK